LKRSLLILSFIAFTSISAQAQSRENGANGNGSSVVSFYPNPATSNITFDLQKLSDRGLTLQIFSFMGGRKMFEQSNLGGKATINLSDYTRGVYIYQVRDRSGKLIESGKFQVSK
jgi:hypothetical protein